MKIQKKSETIKAIFTNLLFVIGVALTITGFSKGTLTVARLVVFDKYPLQTYEETRCELEITTKPMIEGQKDTETLEERQTRYKKCTENLEASRKILEVEDIVTSVTLLVSGIALVYFFKRFILK